MDLSTANGLFVDEKYEEVSVCMWGGARREFPIFLEFCFRL
jgi:hypothetical protein